MIQSQHRLLAIFVLFSLAYFGQSCRTSTEASVDQDLYALAVVKGTYQGSVISGTVKFSQLKSENVLRVNVNITGIPKGLGPKHGMHVHQNAISVVSDDTAQVCGSSGGHFNPLNVNHGNIDASVRHAGDFGNVISDENGKIVFSLNDTVSKLQGPLSIVGRTLVLHQLEDDLGLKNDTNSKANGNAGARIACGVIGLVAN